MIVVRLLGILLDVLLLPIRLLRRGVPKGTWLTVTIDGLVVDIVKKPRFWEVRSQKATSIFALDEAVSAMLRDDRVRGLLVTLRSMSGGMASASSLRTVLAKARAAGKEVVVHLPMGGATKEVFVASAATKVFLGPATHLAPLGFRTSPRYLKRALDHAGIEPQVFACGEFKSLGETLVRESMSDAQRTQLEHLFQSFHDALLDAIVEGRRVTREAAATIVDEAPHFGSKAIACGLADDLAYEDELPGKLGIDRRAMIDAGRYLAAAKRPLVRPLRAHPIIAVVPVHGAIAHAVGPFGDLSTDERVTRMVRAVRRDRRVRGVILHVDSPGGSALASDVMHHEIAQLAREKPVVACMANVAASGGYYVAAPASFIVAEPTTVTGSIGVVAVRLSFESLLARLGITTEVIQRGAHASLLSPTGPLDEEGRATVQRELDAMYRTFVDVVASGRSMPFDDAERLARGRVYTGKDALALSLVDALGGFATALEEIQRRTKLDRIDVRVARPPRHPIPPPKTARALLATLLPARERVLFELAGERVLALGPLLET